MLGMKDEHAKEKENDYDGKAIFQTSFRALKIYQALKGLRMFHLRWCKPNVISTFSLFLYPSLSMMSFSFLSIYWLIKLALGLRTGRSLYLTDTHRHCPFSTIGNMFQIHPVSENELISIARPIPQASARVKPVSH